jgi:uncharacterized RDD family membrane protein YckC
MKCPKCGYHSFEYLERCRKCGNDLAAFKAKFNLRSLIFPKRQSGATAPVVAGEVFAFVAEQPAPGAAAAVTAVAVTAASTTVANATDFGFDFMDETPGADASSQIPTGAEDPFPDEIASPAGKGAFDGEAFDWNAEDETEKEATGADEKEDTVDATAGDDSFGLDLSWDAELPVLEQAAAVEPEDPADPLDMDSLSDWDFEAESPLAPEGETVKTKGQEAPRDPFEVREPEMETPVPEVDLRTLSPASPPPAGTAEDSATAAMTSVAVAVDEVLPAAAPEVAVAAEGDEAEVASGLPRALALGVDLLLLGGIILLFLIAGERALTPGASGRLLPSLESLLRLAIPYFLVGFSLSFGYFTLFHFLIGQTPGKMLLHLRVETDEGLPLDLPQAFLRSTGGLFALLTGGLGFLGILSARRRGWNDLFAGTRVVAAMPEGETTE